MVDAAMIALNEDILRELRAMARDGGYSFEPAPSAPQSRINPRDPRHDGVAKDLLFDGERVAIAATDGTTYCCGVTFEAFFRAWLRHDATFAGLSAADVRAMVAEWFCPTMGHPGAPQALISRNMGRPVALGDAIPGDLIQFWRRTNLDNPSGHSAVFLSWDGSALTYLSSQGATNGVGEHTEHPGPGWTMHLARAVVYR